MKRLLAFVLLLLCCLTALCGCREIDYVETEKWVDDALRVETWEEIEETGWPVIDMEYVVPDMKTAIYMADTYLELIRDSGNWYGGKRIVPSSVMYNTEREFWVVTYSDIGPPRPGYSHKIAIDKKTGAMLCAWLG